MNKPPKRPESPKKSPPSTAIQKSAGVKTDISPDQEMIQTIRQLKNGLQDYEIRQLVTQAEKLGNHLVDQGLKTNQIRKFLDAVNRLKVKLSQDETQQFKTIEDEVILLNPNSLMPPPVSKVAIKAQFNPWLMSSLSPLTMCMIPLILLA